MGLREAKLCNRGKWERKEARSNLQKAKRSTFTELAEVSLSDEAMACQTQTKASEPK